MILVFGSINADVVLTVPRLPAAGETVLATESRVEPGGKGANQALAAARAGAATAFVGAVGRDAFAAVARAALVAAGVDVARLAERDGATGTAMICVDPAGENQIVVASGANALVEAAMLGEGTLHPGVTLLLQGELPAAESAAAARQARAAGARVILNLAPAGPFPADGLAAVDVLVVNQREAAALVGARPPLEQARALAAGRTCIVTLGPEGAVAAMPEGATLRVPALPVAVVDAVGAGDAFVGALAAWLDGGADMAEALEAAAVAGSLACTGPGAQAALPDRAAIRRRLGRPPT